MVVGVYRFSETGNMQAVASASAVRYSKSETDIRMAPLFLSRTFHSERNGRIDVLRFFGMVRVTVDGFHESGRYLRLVWRDVIRHIPDTVPVRKVLMLGLAGGCSLAEIYRRYPEAQVTAIEWDPVMIEIFHLVEPVPMDRAPRIVEGDAFERVTQLGEKFDVVLVDIFRGGIPDQRLASDEFAKRLQDVLVPGGILALNAFRSLDFFPVFQGHFTELTRWHHEFNTLALYQ